MNKRQYKKELRKSNIKINSIKLDKDDIIILRISDDKYNAKQMQYIFDQTKLIFPNNKIMLYPKDTVINIIKHNTN